MKLPFVILKVALLASLSVVFAVLTGCSGKSNGPKSRNFEMGFTSWSYGPDLQDVNDTYSFLETHGDVYVEHIDNKIPWNAWINDLELPTDFTNEISGRAARRIASKKLLVSVSLLNLSRSDLAEDYDQPIPEYVALNDANIEDAYVKHLNYLIGQFDPDYMVVTIEANELKLHSEQKWNEYKLLIANVKTRLKTLHPDLPLSESISIHNLIEPDVSNPSSFVNDVVQHMNKMDFVAISYYPFLHGKTSQTQFQETFDFINGVITRPIAFVETSHIAEDLIIPNFNLSIEGDQTGQQSYLKTLLKNAQNENYEFVIWWAHRDFDELWKTFPDEVKDLGQLWRDTGLIDEDGMERMAFSTWRSYFKRNLKAD